MDSLPVIIPAAAASLAYLNARHGITYDLPLLRGFVSAAFGAMRQERNDTLNLFYELESHATSSRANHAWIIFQGQTWTYGQAYDIVLRYGVWLKSKGVEKDEIVAMDFVNSETFIWVWFGLWSIGARPAFVNYNLTGKSLVHTIKTSTARLVLVDENGREKYQAASLEEHGLFSQGENQFAYEMEASEVPRSVRNQTTASQPDSIQTKVQRQVNVIHFDKAIETQILASPPTRQSNNERAGQQRSSMAMLIYTSGTTGLPKPAVVSWGKANLGSRFASSWLGLQNDVFYTAMPLYHSSASILGLCGTLRAGGTISLSAKFSHKTFWPEVRASNATIIQYVGETCRYLLSAPPSPLDKEHKLRAAFGNGLRPDVWEAFKKRFNIPEIYEFYAATESPSGMWNHSRNTFSSGAIGRNGGLASLVFSSSLCLVRIDPESDTASPLRDPRTRLCELASWNEPGELLYKLDAANINDKFQGYFGNAAATDSKVIRDVKAKGDAYFRTGDLMRWDKDGRWWFVDRIGDTFRWKAENVSTAEVAEVVGKHASVQEANVYGVQVPRHDGRAGCAAVVLSERGESTLRDLAEHVKRGLPAFAQPIWLRVTREMQTTGTNKQQKHLLQKDGIDPEAVERAGDELFWLKDGTYVKFSKKDLERIQGGGVKL